MVNTRNKTYSPPVEDEGFAKSVETLAERRQRWSTLLQQQHYQPVITEIIDEELPRYQNSTIIDSTDRVSHMHQCALILASATATFSAAVEGNLVKRMMRDTNLQTEYAMIQERAYNQPSIYIHLLADELGVAPTPNQYVTLRDMVLDYLADGQTSKHAWHLDNITPPTVSKAASSQGHRKYLHTSSRSVKRFETLHRFCEGIQKRWLETPASMHDVPFKFPPGECGYSKNAHIRLTQHRAHQSSNYIMNLVEDTCTYLHRTEQFKQHFRMHQFIIFLIFKPTQAAIAEIFCSGLLQVWVDNGGGFNAYPAGRSVATAQKVSAGEWIAHEKWIRELSPVDEIMRMQRRRTEEWRSALDWVSFRVVDEEMVEETADENGDEDR
jgi:hypothetical protein